MKRKNSRLTSILIVVLGILAIIPGLTWAMQGVGSTNGVCGSANGGSFTTAPSINLCSFGSIGTVTGTGPWYWNCNGLGGGSNASCSANKNVPPTPGTFTASGNMATARDGGTITVLPNGKVLVTGGWNDDNCVSINAPELYNQSTGTFTPTGNMTTDREHHTATLLPNGKVLIIGGDSYQEGTQNYLSSAEIYDPSTGTFSSTGSMANARQFHTATLLPNGQVLVTGGNEQSGPISSAEIYDPPSGTFISTGNMIYTRGSHTATLLANGKVLITGGINLATAEIYDPSAGTFNGTRSMAYQRSSHTATLLIDGKVLIAGGGELGLPTASSTELYDPSNGTFSPAGNMTTTRGGQTATLLPNGKVLLAGGYTYIGLPMALATAETFDPATNTFAATAKNMTMPRALASAVLMSNAQVLFTGGTGQQSVESGNTTATEIFNMAATLGTMTLPWPGNQNMQTARQHHTATLLPNGDTLIAGGDAVSHYAELYTHLNGTPSGSFNKTGNMIFYRRINHTATLLLTGQVLI